MTTKTDQESLAREYSKFIAGVDIEHLYVKSGSFELRSAVLPQAPMKFDLKDTPEVKDLTENGLVVEHSYRLGLKQEGKKKAMVVVTATYVVVYTIGQQPSEEILGTFLNRNVALNTWPYFREHVYSSFARMYLPPLVLPAFKG